MSEYGDLIVRLVEKEPEVLNPWPTRSLPPDSYVVVDRADRVVSASAEVLLWAERQGWVTAPGVLTVGTAGHGLGVVKYEIRPHPAGPQFRELHRIDEWSDRDR